MSVPTTLFGFCHAREVVEYCFCRCTGYGPRYCGLTCAPYLTFSICFLVLTERVSPVGWFQTSSWLWSRQSKKSSEEEFGASPVGDTGRSRKRCLARPFGQRGRPEAGWRPKRGLRSERRARVRNGCHSSSARPSGRRLDCPSGLLFRYLGRPRSCALSAWAEPLLGSRSARDPGFMNPTEYTIKYLYIGNKIWR
jgi:hypothetical protein